MMLMQVILQAARRGFGLRRLSRSSRVTGGRRRRVPVDLDALDAAGRRPARRRASVTGG